MMRIRQTLRSFFLSQLFFPAVRTNCWRVVSATIRPFVYIISTHRNWPCPFNCSPLGCRLFVRLASVCKRGEQSWSESPCIFWGKGRGCQRVTYWQIRTHFRHCRHHPPPPHLWTDCLWGGGPSDGLLFHHFRTWTSGWLTRLIFPNPYKVFLNIYAMDVSPFNIL